MSRFNSASTTQTKTVNKAGGEAYKESPKLELVSLLLTSFVQDQFYSKADDQLKRLVGMIDALSDKQFAAKAAIYARNEFGMRSISHAVAGEVGAKVKGQDWTRRFMDKVVKRPDDITEILSYYLGKYGKPVPNSMKRGLGDAMGKFDSYQLGKYRGEGNALSLIDVVNLIHPTPTEKNADALRQLVKGTLRSTDTWETKLSASGKSDNKEAAKAEAWSELVTSKKIGYFALLRNLRNILEQAPEVVDAALELLVDEKAIKRSLVMPFRFYTAYNEIAQLNGADARKTMAAIAAALDISFANVPKFDGNTLVVVDHSGSMDSAMSDNSKATLFQIGAIFGLALAKSNNADLMYFGDTAKFYNVTDGSAISQMQTLNGLNNGFGSRNDGTSVGHGTNFNAIFEEAHDKYDRIVIFSDMQGWIGYYAPTKTFADYKKRTGAQPKVYSIDLAGHGTLQFPENNVYALAGFSEKIFDLMSVLEQDRNALVAKIEKVEL